MLSSLAWRELSALLTSGHGLCMAGALVVALLWLTERAARISEGGIPLARDPLLALRRTLDHLWRNRRLLRMLLVIWIAAAALHGLGPAALLMLEYSAGADLSLAAPGFAFGAGRLATAVSGILAASVPGVIRGPLQCFGAALGAAGLAWMLYRLLANTSERAARGRLQTTVRLAALGAAATAALAVVDAGGCFSGFTETVGGWRGALLLAGEALTSAVLLAPLWTALWYAVLRVVEGPDWSAARALSAAVRCWRPAAAMLLIVALPEALLGASAFPLLPEPVAWLREPWMALALAAVGPVFALAPWIIVDRKVGLVEALGTSWRLVRSSGRDAISFALRFIVLFGALHALLSLATPTVSAEASSAAEALQRLVVVAVSVPRQFVLLLQAGTIACFYVTLRDRQARAADVDQADAGHSPRGEE